MSIVNRIVDQVYVINMDSQTDRMKHIDSTLKHHGIQYTRFSAIKGVDVKYSDNLTSYCNKFCPDGMKGCALSHREIWKQMVANQYSYVLILEDDIELNPVFFETIMNGWNAVPKDFDVLWLGCHTVVEDNTPFAYAVTKALKREPEQINEYVLKSVCGFGAYGYILSRKCAERFLDLQIPFHIDFTMAKWIETYELKSYVLRELPVKPNEEAHVGSSLSDTFPKGLNTLLKRIPASKQTNLDWTLGESFAKVGPFTLNILIVLLCIVVAVIPLRWVPYIFLWLGAEFLVSFDTKNTMKFAVFFSIITAIRLAFSPRRLRF